MAAKKYFVDINLNKNQITEFSLENRINDPLDPKSGEIYFNLNDKKIKFFDGAGWQSIGEISAKYLTYKGAIAHSSEEPLDSKIGDVYVFSSNGKTINFSQMEVEIGDFAIYNGNSWDILQKNTDIKNASQETNGLISIASENETFDGKINNKAITPLGLEKFRKNKTLTTVLEFVDYKITSDGNIIIHNLNNKNIIVEFFENEEKVILFYKIIDDNSILVKSNFDIFNIKIIIFGHKA